MIKTFLLAVFAAVTSLAVYLYFYLGFYKPVTISIEERGPLALLYTNHVGPYHEIGNSLHAVESFAQSQNLACPETFGEYLDNPNATDEDRLRSHAGCILTASPPTNLKSEYTFEQRPKAKYVVGHFEGSPAIGPFKAYPALKKYIQTNSLTTSAVALEIYRISGEAVTTEYLFLIK